MTRPITPKEHGSPHQNTPSKPNPKPERPAYPPKYDTGRRTEFGDKKSGGPGTNNTGAKK